MIQTFDVDAITSKHARMAAYQERNIGHKESQKEMLASLALTNMEYIELSEYCKEAHISYVNGNEITVDEAFICGMSGGPVLNAQGEVIGLITRGSEAETYDRNGVFLAIDYVLNPYGRNKG